MAKKADCFRQPVFLFVGEKKLDYSDISSVPEGDYVAADQAELYYVSLDTAGEIPWESGMYSAKGRPDAHVIEILTESTPKGYRAFHRYLSGWDTCLPV